MSHARGKERRVLESRGKHLECPENEGGRVSWEEREAQMWLEGLEGGQITQSLREEGPTHGGHSVNTCGIMK